VKIVNSKIYLKTLIIEWKEKIWKNGWILKKKKKKKIKKNFIKKKEKKKKKKKKKKINKDCKENNIEKSMFSS